MFSQHVEILGSIGDVVARKDMNLHFFSFSRFTPSYGAPGIFFCPKECDLTGIRTRHVTRSHPTKYVWVLFAKGFGCCEKGIESWEPKASFAASAPTITLLGDFHVLRLSWRARSSRSGSGKRSGSR